MPTLLGWHNFPTLYWKVWGPTSVQHCSVGSGTLFYLCKQSSSHWEEPVVHALSQRLSAPLCYRPRKELMNPRSKKERQQRSRQLWIVHYASPKPHVHWGPLTCPFSISQPTLVCPHFLRLPGSDSFLWTPFIVSLLSKPWEETPILWISVS